MCKREPKGQPGLGMSRTPVSAAATRSKHIDDETIPPGSTAAWGLGIRVGRSITEGGACQKDLRWLASQSQPVGWGEGWVRMGERDDMSWTHPSCRGTAPRTSGCRRGQAW